MRVVNTHLTVGKLSELWLSFLLCNYVLYRRMFWQSIEDFYYLLENTDLKKKHQGYSSWFFQKWRFRVGNGIEPFYARMYVYMS